MSSKSIQIIGGPDRQHAYVDAATNALLVKVVNPGSGGGPTTDVNLASYGGVAVGPANALDVQPGTGAVFAVSDNGGSLTVDGTVAVTQGSSPWTVDGTVNVGNFPATQPVSGTVTANQGTSPWVVGDGGGSITIDGSVAISGTVAVTQSTSPWVVSGTVAVSNFPATQPVSGTVTANQGTSPWVVSQGSAWIVEQSSRSDLQVNANLRVLDADVDFDNHVPISIYGEGSMGPVDVVEDGEVTSGLEFAGMLPMFEVTDGPVPAGSSGTFNHAFMTEQGSVYVHIGSSDIDQLVTTPASGTMVGTPAFTVRRDTPIATALDGALDFFTSDASGRLWCNVNVVTPGTAAANLGKAEDAIAGSGDTGVMALAVRADTAAATGANGDYVPLLTDATGKLHVTVGNATLAVTQSTSPWVVSLASTTITGTVAVTQSTSPWVVSLTSTTITSQVPGTGATNLGKAEDAVAGSGDTGVMALAVRADSAASTAANGDYHPLLVDNKGQLWVNVANATLAVTQSGTWNIATVTTVSSVSAVIPGTGATNLGKAEDAAHVTGDTGVMGLAVRRDTLTALATTDGDYIPLATNSVGALWTKEAGLVTLALSGSTRGRPIQITGTGTGSTVTLHTATTTSGEIDRVYIDLTNTSASAVLVTIEFGTTGAGNELKITVPAGETVPAVVGMVIGGAATDTIKAYAATANVINAVGRVERLS